MIFDSWTKALIYFGVINVLGLIVMGADKWKAKHNAWRIPEKTLFLVSLLGGSIGTWAGMYLFRHKTKHWYFVVGMPAILVVQVLILVWMICSRLRLAAFFSLLFFMIVDIVSEKSERTCKWKYTKINSFGGKCRYNRNRLVLMVYCS